MATTTGTRERLAAIAAETGDKVAYPFPLRGGAAGAMVLGPARPGDTVRIVPREGRAQFATATRVVAEVKGRGQRANDTLVEVRESGSRRRLTR